jgi:hypothetical protein
MACFTFRLPLFRLAVLQINLIRQHPLQPPHASVDRELGRLLFGLSLDDDAAPVLKLNTMRRQACNFLHRLYTAQLKTLSSLTT